MLINTIIVSNASDLDKLKSGLKPNTRIKLALPKLHGLQSELAQNNLSQLSAPCGCKQGAIGLLIGIGLSLGSTPFGTSWPSWLAVIVTTTFTGKLFGLYSEKQALRAEISCLKKYA